MKRIPTQTEAPTPTPYTGKVTGPPEVGCKVNVFTQTLRKGGTPLRSGSHRTEL